MPGALKLGFAPFAAPTKGVLIVFCEEGLKFGAAARKAVRTKGPRKRATAARKAARTRARKAR